MAKQKQVPTASQDYQYDTTLIKTLEEILHDDQTLRKQINDTKSEEEKRYLCGKIEVIDAINLKKLEEIFATHGFPGKSKVGEALSSVCFLVIQHAPIEAQEKYFPLLEQAAKEGEMRMSHLALLIDRIRMRKGKKQIYGSQIVTGADGKRKIYDIEDERNVNKRRKTVDLMPLEEYVRQFGIEYTNTSQ